MYWDFKQMPITVAVDTTPVIGIVIFTLLSFYRVDSVVVGQYMVVERYQQLWHITDSFCIYRRINHSVIESDVSEAVHFAVAHQEIMERRELSVNGFGRASEAGYNQKIVGQSKIAVAPLPASKI